MLPGLRTDAGEILLTPRRVIIIIAIAEQLIDDLTKRVLYFVRRQFSAILRHLSHLSEGGRRKKAPTKL